jgi:Amt family ammonium transporter
MTTLAYFQFVFAAITVILLAGAVLGRFSFKAWIVFVPVWITVVYSVNAFSLWGGGWLRVMPPGCRVWPGRERSTIQEAT